MDYLGISIENGRFNVDDMLKLVSNKTLRDFRYTEIFKAIIESDNDAIMDGYSKIEYFNSLLYWAAPKVAFLIENHKPWKEKKEESLKSGGSIYLIRIGERLYKYGRTKNMRKRILQYPQGSTLLRNDFVNDMIKAEKVLLNTVKESNGRLFHGNEYFTLEDDNEATKIYDLAIERINKLGY